MTLRSSQYLFGLRMKFGFYFDRIFAGNEKNSELYRLFFEHLGDLGFERGKGVTSITVGVLMILRSYKDRKKLKALAKLTSRKGEDILEITEIGIELCIVDYALELEARRNLLPLLERAHVVGEGLIEEEVLDSVFVLGRAYNRMREWDVCRACYKRVKEGFVRLLGRIMPIALRSPTACH